MCIRDSYYTVFANGDAGYTTLAPRSARTGFGIVDFGDQLNAVSYTHLRAHETVLDLVCRLLLETKTPQLTRKHETNRQQIYSHDVAYVRQ